MNNIYLHTFINSSDNSRICFIVTIFCGDFWSLLQKNTISRKRIQKVKIIIEYIRGNILLIKNNLHAADIISTFAAILQISWCITSNREGIVFILSGRTIFPVTLMLFISSSLLVRPALHSEQSIISPLFLLLYT